MWHVHHTMIHVIHCLLYEIYCIILSVLFAAVFMLNFHPPVFFGNSWHRSAISCQSVLFRFLYAFPYHLFILSKINWQFVFHFISEPLCTFKYMLSFLRATSLCMLDWWCIIHAQFYLWFLSVFLFFLYTDFYLRKIRWSLFLLIPWIVSVLVIRISCTKSLF